MNKSLLLTFTTAALITASSAMACGRDRDNASPDSDSVYEVSTQGRHAMRGQRQRGNHEGRQHRERRGPDVFEVGNKAEDDQVQVQDTDPGAPDADTPPRERPERAERGQRGQRGEGALLRGLELTEEQQTQVNEIMAKAREQADALRERVRNARENGDEVDREAIRTRSREIMTTAFQKVYDEVLTDEQRATVDERRAEMEKRRAERAERREGGEGAEGDRPRPPRGEGEEGERPQRRRGGGGGDDLDL